MVEINSPFNVFKNNSSIFRVNGYVKTELSLLIPINSRNRKLIDALFSLKSLNILTRVKKNIIFNCATK